ncbi:MAG TPA: IS1634 family transposase [Methanothrix sp.]|nr:IS1634 family transposase [Methanothrix sp.]
MEIRTLQLDHLGLVTGVFDQLDIADLIDNRIPKLRNHNLEHSKIIKAMILNGLGYVGQRLYLFSEFYEKLPIERLLGDGVTASDLNDDALGRTLDAIYAYGPTELFNDISLKVMSQLDLGVQRLHADTTSFSVQGNYEGPSGQNAIEITLGHSKDGRMDLKQFVLGLVTNQDGIPLFAKAHSGNASDKNTIMESFLKVKNGLNLDDAAYYIADSAVYSEKNIKQLGTDTLWITRVPATLAECKRLIDSDLDLIECSDPRYKCFSTSSNYGDISQRWVVYQSKPMMERMERTFEKRLEKEDRTAERDLAKLERREFVCEADARKEAEIWLTKHPLHKFRDLSVKLVTKRVDKKRGLPKNGEMLIEVHFIDAQIELDDDKVSKEKTRLGRFILATNDLNIDPDTILSYYKGQQAVEQGFRFLKDKSFRVAEVYLKKEERIEALAMIMVLTLMIYSIAEWLIRKRMREMGETVPSQLKKPTQKPTFKWIAFLFMGVAEVTIWINGEMHLKIANLNDNLVKIIRLLGQDCEKYYALER